MVRAVAAVLRLLQARRLLAKVRPVLALFYRRLFLHRVVFVGVTGSCGKTTTKELIAAVLSAQFEGDKSPGTSNLPEQIAGDVLRVKPWDKFHVQEIAAAVRGVRIPLERSLRFVQPQIGVVTNIGTDHINVFHTVEAIAAEKAKLIAALPQHGTAILNADDPNVLAMQATCAGRVITYGLTREAMVRAENVRCTWPDRLSFTILHAGQSHAVHTQLWGKHWVSCVLAAVAVGIVMGVPLAKAVQAVQAVPPFRKRMCSIDHPDGVTFIQDDVKAPLWSIPPVLEFMKDARARRKIVVVGTISDYQGNSDRQYLSVARQALEVADCVVFVGPRASKCLKAKRHPQDHALQAFYSVEAARGYLGHALQPGDLVLLKGTVADHLERLIAARTTEGWPRPENSIAGRTAQAVVGLGNPGEQYLDTPHNVGQRVLDLLARSVGGEWVQEGQALVARVESWGATVFLIKPLTYVNATGPVLLQLSQQLGFKAADCVLVHDDIDLPVGTVRVRMAGSDGGHRGVRSILEAFRTDALRRVKIGVRIPGQRDVDYVVKTFATTERPLIERACVEAAERAMALLSPPKGEAEDFL